MWSVSGMPRWGVSSRRAGISRADGRRRLCQADGMGTEVEPRVFSRADRAAYRQKVRTSLDVFAQMLSEARFDFELPMTGLEIELNLVDERAEPAMRNAEVLAAIADPSFQTELGQFNIEINVAPRRLAGDGFTGFEEQVRASLNAADTKAREVGARLVMI